MSRRRRRSLEEKKPFSGAHASVNLWETRVCYSTVTTNFTITDFCNWLYPPEALRVLRAAFELTQESHPDRTEELNVPDYRYGGEGHFAIRIDCDDARMCTPRAGLACADPGKDKWGIIEALFEFERIKNEWDVVRKVVNWFNDNATPGCARYYFPAMGNFLDREHPFHQITKPVFGPPKRSLSEIAGDIRTAAETVAMATFCPHETKARTGLVLTIQDKEGYNTSQQFIF